MPRGQAQALRAILAQPGVICCAGCYDALSAKLVEEAGFPLIYTSGAGIANAHLGMADVGLLTATENRWIVERIVAAVRLPVIVDIDTGYGNPINVRRTIQDMERIGIAGVQIEDQVMPKKCGHFAGKEVISKEEMVQKIRAVVDSREEGMVIIARTDARAVHDLDDAIDRAKAYVEAGADATFIEAPRSLEEMARIGREMRGVPQVANMVDGGKTPILPLAELDALGFKLVTYANVALRSAVLAMQRALAQLQADGDSRNLQDVLLPWEERQRIVGLPYFESLERKYRG